MRKVVLLIGVVLMSLAASAQNKGLDGAQQSKPQHKGPHPVRFKQISRSMPKEWYATDEAMAAADSVIKFQFPSGGWGKNHDWHVAPEGKRVKERQEIWEQIHSKSGVGATIDNGATTTEMLLLAKVYSATGKKKYLDEAKFLLDYRGKTNIKNSYSQSHKPVVEQDEAVGHAVRATYMYAGMADVAALTGDSAYIQAIDRIWQNIVGKKLYITGGIGATSDGEAFGRNYELPNMSAYCETCAAIGNVYVNYRLFLLHGESKYYDVLERTLYNGLISGVSLQGDGFFYPNPLESMGQHQRQPWFGCACCPSNICRFIPSLPGYVYATADKKIYINLFLANSATLNIGGKKVGLTQQTNYPWNGDISVIIDKNQAGSFTLKLRLPGWLQNRPTPSDLYRYTDDKQLGYKVSINGKDIDAQLTADGYLTIDRKWKKGDRVDLHFDMEPRIVRANSNVEADRGRVAVERGPLVYCAEHPDNDFDIFSALMSQKPTFNLKENQVAGNKIVMLTTDVQTLDFNKQGQLVVTDQKLTLIPYYAWCHRGSGKMRIWLPQDLSATTPAMPATMASVK